MVHQNDLDHLQLQIYIISGIGLVFCGILFSFVVTLFIETRRLKKELRNPPKDTHRFHVPYIDPQEDMAKRGYAQYPPLPKTQQY